jgi:hypothetical protein
MFVFSTWHNPPQDCTLLKQSNYPREDSQRLYDREALGDAAVVIEEVGVTLNITDTMTEAKFSNNI